MKGRDAMFKGSTYCRRWVYQGKKRKAWGVRYSVNGKATRKIVADTKEGALAELERLKEDYKRRMLGVAEGKTLRELAVPFLEHKSEISRRWRPGSRTSWPTSGTPLLRGWRRASTATS